MSILTCVLCVALIAIAAYTVVSYRQKLRSGCCGGSGDQVKAVGKQPNGAAYPYACRAVIEGMMCQNCAARIENTINQEADLHGKVELGKKLLTVRSMQPVQEARIRQLVARTGYRVVSFQCTSL